MILVTGGTGFLGQHLMPLLARVGLPLRALVRPGSDTVGLADDGVELATVDDIADTAAVARACRGCEVVIHAAGHFRFWGPRAPFWRANVAGTEAVLAAAQAAGVRRLVHVSSVVVVGRAGPGRVIDETVACHPLDDYQASKLAGERLARRAGREGQLEVIVVRPGAFYGPGGRYAFNRLFFEEPLRGWRIQVNGGRHLTFPAYAPDVAAGILLALRHGRAGEIYNLCGPPITHRAANAIISELADIPAFRLPVPTVAALALAHALTALARLTRREPFYPTSLAHYVFQDWPVSAAKAETELGFAPTPFREGARATVAWYRDVLSRRAAGAQDGKPGTRWRGAVGGIVGGAGRRARR